MCIAVFAVMCQSSPMPVLYVAHAGVIRSSLLVLFHLLALYFAASHSPVFGQPSSYPPQSTLLLLIEDKLRMTCHNFSGTPVLRSWHSYIEKLAAYQLEILRKRVRSHEVPSLTSILDGHKRDSSLSLYIRSSEPIARFCLPRCSSA